MPTARDMAHLGASMLASYQGRAAEIGTIRAEVGAHNRQTRRFMGGLHRGSQARQRTVEADSRQTRRFMGGLHRDDQARRAEVSDHLQQARQFVEELHQGTQARRAQTHQFLGEVRQFVKELHRGSQVRKRAVVAQMAAYAGEVRGALAEWRRHQAAMGAARRAVTTQPRPKMATERAPKAHAMSSGADSDLAERILTFVAAHPGTRLPAIEEELGVSRIEAGRTIRELMDQGKVRRNDETREYFPR